ncbi:MAG: hypothetical protein FD177_1022 [Desulfovibrionaceae bacterium]|nr:MAG: hypothetical protein FD177_1022 [Desulfovibrionaceae bacterium]
MKALPPELDLYTELSSTPFPGGFPCQVVKPRQGVKYVSDEYCADFRRRAVCFDCGRGKLQERKKADASGILAQIIKKENGDMVTKRGTCEHCEREDMAIAARGLCANCYGKYNRGTLPPKPAKVEEVAPEPHPEWTEGVKGETAEPRHHGECLGGFMPTEDAKPLELSWDDFDEVSRHTPVGAIMANVQKNDRITLSTALILALGWPAGTPVECRISQDKQRIAIRRVDTYRRGSQYKLTSGSRGRGLAINCNAVLRATETPGGSYSVDITSWGCVVRTDMPLAARD